MNQNTETSAFEFRRQERLKIAGEQPREVMSKSEKRRMLAEAVTAFRETQKAWSFDTDVIQLIDERGSIPFDVWMNSVLYGPEGYYTSGRCKINSGDFMTVASDPGHVAAFYFAIADHILERHIDVDDCRVLSVASGAGNFEQLFSQIHRYASTADPEYSLPGDTQLISVDISEKNLDKQQKDRTVAQYAALRSRLPTEEDALLVNGSLRIPFELLFSVCKCYECTGKLISEDEYRRYYFEHILPYFKHHASQDVYGFFVDNMEAFKYIAPFFTSSASTLIAGSAFDLPFARNSADVIFSNELHDVLPCKVFVADHDKDNFEELYIGYDHTHGTFNFSTKPVDATAQKMLDLKMAYVREERAAIPYSRELKKDYLVVNGGSLAYMVEATRVLKHGGTLINADYVPVMSKKDTEFLRVQGVGGWNDIFSNIATYKPPWLDVTVDMNAEFLQWVGDAMGLSHLQTATQDDLTYSLTGSSGKIAMSDCFVCQFFEKR